MKNDPVTKLLLSVIAIALVAVKLTGMRFILFPPLVVILYEMLSHREHCPWVGRPIALPTACFLAAVGGFGDLGDRFAGLHNVGAHARIL